VRMSLKARKERKEKTVRSERIRTKIPRHAEESLIPEQPNNSTTGNSPFRVLWVT